MKHKFLTVLLAIVSVFSLCIGPAACGENGNLDNNGSSGQGGSGQGGSGQSGSGQSGSGQGGSGQGGSGQGGSGQDSGTADPHTIKVLMLANIYESRCYDGFFDHLEQQFANEGLDYTIDVQYSQSADYYKVLDASIAKDDTPDIFYLLPNEILRYRKEIVSLQSYADTQEEADLAGIYPVALDMYRYNPATGELGNHEDDLYAFPKELATMQLGYNKTLLEQFTAAIKEKLPTYEEPWVKDFSEGTYTWEEYKTICAAIADAASTMGGGLYASDVPPVEVLARSFGGELIDLSGGRANGTVADLTEGAVQRAIEYQAELVDCGGANYAGATYANFTLGKVCFYGQAGSWESADYNTCLGDGNWGVMPWPTADGDTDWQGAIMSSGLAVSKKCAENAENPEKGEIAKRIAVSFLSPYAQDKFVREDQITLPLRKIVEDHYRDPENDTIYSPSTRGVFLDVVSGKNGFIPAEYSTYDSGWLYALKEKLEIVWDAGKGSALKTCKNLDWTAVRQSMQTRYDESKNK